MTETELINRFDSLVANTQPAARRVLAQEIARYLRNQAQQHVRAQQAPDGTPFAPRLPQKYGKGRLRRKLFAKLMSARHLKAKATAVTAIVEFTPNTGRIARVHHFDLEDQVKPGIRHRYAARPLLGITETDKGWVEDAILSHLSK